MKLTPREFYDEYLPAAEANFKNYGVPKLITLAQAALESAWAERAPGFNFFGIKAGKSWNGKTQMLTTREFVNGGWIKIQAPFRAYDNAEQCFADYAEVLKKNFPHAFKAQNDLQFVQALVSGKKKYATDPDYVSKITQIANKFRKYEQEKPMGLIENKDLVELKLIARGMDQQPVKAETNYIMAHLGKIPEAPGVEFGIEETMDVVDFGVDFANAVIKTFEDGKVTPGDIIHFVSPVIKLPSAISGLEMVPAEIENMDEAELQTVVNSVMEKLNVPEDKAREIVKRSIEAVYSVYQLVKAVKA